MPEISKFTGGFAGFSSMSSSYGPTGEDEAAEYVGSTMVFVQNTTPTGWTRITSYDNHMLRVTSGNISTNPGGLGFDTLVRTNIGSPNFTFGGSSSWSFGPTTITVPTSGNHTHNLQQTSSTTVYGPGPVLGTTAATVTSMSPVTFTSGAHSHPAATAPVSSVAIPAGQSLNVQYRDCILATRN